MDFYTTKTGQRIAIHPSSNSQPLGEDHMTVFRRLAKFTGSTPGTNNCIHNNPQPRTKRNS